MDEKKIANMLFDQFILFLTADTEQPLTEQPEAQPLIEALQEHCPDAQPGGWLAKLFLAFAGGVNAGFKMQEALNQ